MDFGSFKISDQSIRYICGAAIIIYAGFLASRNDRVCELIATGLQKSRAVKRIVA